MKGTGVQGGNALLTKLQGVTQPKHAESQPPNAYLKKTQYDNFYERKLHEERDQHNDFAKSMVMNQLGSKLSNIMH